jgi:DNA replication protein DnaC
MNCDDIIAEKLTKYPMIKEAFSTTSFNVICGRMGSGKTFIANFSRKKVFKKCFETIYVFMPSNSRASH